MCLSSRFLRLSINHNNEQMIDIHKTVLSISVYEFAEENNYSTRIFIQTLSLHKLHYHKCFITKNLHLLPSVRNPNRSFVYNSTVDNANTT